MSIKTVISIFLSFVISFVGCFIYFNNIIDKNKEESQQIINNIRSSTVPLSDFKKLELELSEANNIIEKSYINEGLKIDKTIYNYDLVTKTFDDKIKAISSDKNIKLNNKVPKKNGFNISKNVFLNDIDYTPKDYNQVVCVYDDFVNEYETYNNKTHGDLVIELMRNYYEGPIYYMDMVNFDYNADSILALSNCDIINFSFINDIIDDEITDFVHVMVEFLEYHDVIIIGSAGNDVSRDSSEININGLLKKKGFLKNYFLVSQGVKDGSKLSLTKSTGEEVDIVVINDDMEYNDYDISGTSFASPVVTGVISNLLNDGLEKENIKEIFDSYSVFTYKNVNYKVFLIKETYELGKEIIKKQNN